jgi:hypothetical protein
MNVRVDRAAQRRKSSRFCTCPADRRGLRYPPYWVPRPSACDIEFSRYHQCDVVDLDELEIEAELAAAVRTLAVLSPGAHLIAQEWLRRRYRRLLETQQARARRELPDLTLPAMSDGVPKTRVVVVEVE